MRIGRAVLLACALLGLGGCGRGARTQAPRAATSAAAAADTLANGFPRALAPRLAGWFALWARAGVAVSADSLRHGPPRAYAFRLAPVVHAGRWRENARTRAGIDVLAQDSLHALDFDMELELTRDPDGVVRPERDVDSGPILADFANDSLWIVDFCGTPCGFDGAAWIDAARFAVVGATETGTDTEAIRAAFVDVYDLRQGAVTRWLSRPVGRSHYSAYSAAAESALTARLAVAGADVAAGQTILSRALDEGAPSQPRSAVR